MSSPRNAFSYQPLSESSRGRFETRLIYLHPGGSNDCIYCTIYHANILERRPQTEYAALSYVWGDATQTRSIQLGYHQLLTSETARTWPSAPSPGADCYKPFQVTINLESALRHIRDRASERILWVDAICINQSDWEERLSQVQWMSSVYEKAVEVRIWLGSVSDVCVSTPNIQEELENYQSRRVPIPRGLCSLLSPEDDTGAILSSERRIIEIALQATMDYVMDEDRLLGHTTNDNCFPDELQALGIRIIAMQPWWRRVWVIQEATLSKEDPVMQCGDMQLGYRRFLELAKRYMFQDAPSILSRTHVSLNVHDMSHKGYEPSKTSLASRLLTYLSCMSGNFEVSNPKDRVNGVYGFLRMGDCHDNILYFITRDQYEQTITHFYHRVAIWILFDPKPQSYSLRILESGPSNIEGIPSWVPIWESKKWIGEDKNQGAPESKYDILANGTSMGKTYHQSSVDICVRCTAQYEKKWGTPKSLFDIDVRCTQIRIHNALALGRVITTVEVLSVQDKKDAEVLRKAILEVEERILAALKSKNIPHTDAKKHIRKFRDYLRLNFWDANTGNGSYSSEHSATLEEFLQCKRKSRKKKSQRRGRRVSAHQTDPNVPNPSSIAKLSTFFEHIRDLVVGSSIVGHMFEDSLPPWQCSDRLYLIPECRWVLGLRRSGNGYRYMYRVFVSDLEWQQRKQLFDGKGIYENILLV
jgi:hypothetical protein